MQRTVIVQDYQQVDTEDYNNFGAFAREGIDSLVGDAVTIDKKFVGFPVVSSGPAEVTVGAGRFYRAGQVFFNNDDGGVSIDMISNLPAVAKRIARIVVYGNTIETDVKPKTFLVDPDTMHTEGRDVSVESRRQAYIGVIYGVENATPEPPTPQSDYIGICDIVLTTSGIEDGGIEMLDENRLPSVSGNTESIEEIEQRLAEVGPELDTAKSAIAALANGLLGKADSEFVNEISAKVNSISDSVNGISSTLEVLGAAIRALSTAQPTTPLQSFYDSALDDNLFDTAHVDWNAKLQDGVRYPNAATASANITLSNALDPLVKVSDNLVVPDYISKLRLSVAGSGGEYALTNTTVETLSVKRLARARFIRRYSKIEGIHILGLTYDKPNYDSEKLLFIRSGETFATIEPYRIVEWDLKVLKGSCIIAVMRKPYFRRILSPVTWGGAVTGQTFVSPQDGYLTKLDLFFSRKGSSGDVQIAICEVDASGRPDLNSVLERETLAASAILPSKNGVTPTPINFTPVALRKGDTYAVVIITNGPHFVRYANGNRLTSGSYYWMMDGAWVKDSVSRDLAMGLYFAEFTNPVSEVQLTALELAGGIDSIDINADTATFDNTALEFQIREGNVWRTIGEDETALATKPAVAQFRAVFRGTKDVQPALGIGAARSTVKLGRPATGRTWVTKEITLPSAATKIVIKDKHANWNNTYNAETVTVLRGASFATVETADSVTYYTDSDGSRVYERTYNLGASATSFKIKGVGTTSSGDHCDTIPQVGYVAYA